MTSKIWITLGFVLGGVALSGCAPAVIAAAGAGAVVVADKVAEKDGDDGLF